MGEHEHDVVSCCVEHGHHARICKEQAAAVVRENFMPEPEPVCGIESSSLHSSATCTRPPEHKDLHSWQCSCNINAYDFRERNEQCRVHGTPPPDEWHPCLKRAVRCRIVWDTPLGRSGVTATNSCSIGEATVCPRVTAGFHSGESDELCGPPKHAEQQAVKLLLKRLSLVDPFQDAPQSLPEVGVMDATAYIYGHDWLCRACQHALTAVGVTHFVITGEAA